MNSQVVPEPRLNFSSEEVPTKEVFVFGDKENIKTPAGKRSYKPRKTSSIDKFYENWNFDSTVEESSSDHKNTISDSLAEFMTNEVKGEWFDFFLGN